MNISREDAQSALAEVGEARAKAERAHGYEDAAPFLILWGAIWLLANGVTGLAPAWAGVAWIAGIAVGTPATVALSVMQARRRGPRLEQAGQDPGAFGVRAGVTFGVILAFFAALCFVAAPLDERQVNAMISLFWAFAYMGFGLWIGYRLAIIGAVTAAAILFGFVVLDQAYFLWMGVVGGGGLMAGGLWLRKA